MQKTLKTTFLLSLLTTLCLFAGCQRSVTSVDDGYGIKFNETSDPEKVEID